MIKTFSFKEFRPTILFLVKFIGIYLIGNLLYGFYVTVSKPKPDPATQWVSHQTATMLAMTGHDVEAIDHARKAITLINFEGKTILSIYEGCNGINIIIIFVAFIVAFGPRQKAMTWFIPVGLLIIHLFNIFRIGGLFLVALYLPNFLYFTHKYLFTAFIYFVVLLLWICWVRAYTLKKT